MTEEIIYNANQGNRSCMITCSWCVESFEYRETGDEMHVNTCCPWCREKVTIPRNRLRGINGHNARSVQ